ncbi:phage major capsid protein [Schlesneria sp. DSM 10557]|uniref:phage major capsid protein n=1 Tax=Schlesneria sp. DSM 10557 TaxID=3044399 RepID=UPI00359FC0A8
MSKFDASNILQTMQGRMDAIIEENPQTVPQKAQQEFDACLQVVNLVRQMTTAKIPLDEVGQRVELRNDGQLVTRRQAQRQSEYVAATEGDSTPSRFRQGNRELKHYSPEVIFGEPAPKSEFKSMADFCWNVKQGTQAVRMAAAGANEGIPSDGGYAVPMEQSYEILGASPEGEFMRPRCRVEGMKYGQKIITTPDDSSHATGDVYSGLQLQWVPEAGEIDYQMPKLKQLALYAKKAVIMVPTTNELLADATAYTSSLPTLMGTALGFGLDRTMLVSGVGGGQPLSVLNADSTITVAKDSGQAAATISYANLVNMLGRIHPGCFQNARWVFNPSCIPQLLQMTIPIGTGGSQIPAMSESNGQYRLLSLPVHFSEKLNPLGQLGDCLLLDPTQYVIGIQQNGFRMDQSNHVLFTSDQTVFRLIVRIDGQPIWSKAFQPLNSAPTLSWAVTLAARA